MLGAGNAVLCRPGGLICELFDFVFRIFLWPYLYVQLHVNGEIAEAIGVVHEAGYRPSGLEIGDYVLIGIGILEYLIYWFVVGVLICGVWRAVRKQVQNLWKRPFRQVDLAGQGH